MQGRFQQELFTRFFNELEIRNWILTFIDDLKAGSFDDQLVYRKKLHRRLSEYVKTQPPHVKAALKLDPEGRMKLREVSYIMTAAGPEPIQSVHNPVDYEHYIEKQLRPIADGILVVSGEDFDSLTGGRQLDLFS